MIKYIMAEELARTWVRLATSGSCEITKVEDKPYGWIFFYNAKNFDPTDIRTMVAGNAPFIIDRINFEISVTGTAMPVEHYIKEYEASLSPACLKMTPELSAFTNGREI